MQIGDDICSAAFRCFSAKLRTDRDWLSVSSILNVHLSMCCVLSFERRIEIAAVNDPPRVHLPGQVFRRSLSVVWPDIEEFEVAFTNPLVVDEDTLLDVPSVSISGKSRRIECTA